MHLLLLTLLPLALAAPIQDASTQEWDAIVVGAGPAGIIVADKLSEAGKRTLLLEAGGPSYYSTGGREQPGWLAGTELSRVDVPGLYNSIFDSSTDPSPLLCGASVNAYMGCTIGGSSAVNAGLFFQPPDSDYDTFFPDGWKAADMANATARLYARQSSESITSQDSQLYAQSGYDAARAWLVDGAGYADVDINGAANSKTKVFGRPIYDYNAGLRGGPATTYLPSSQARSNFQLVSGARVLRVLRNGCDATGVLVNLTASGAQVQYTLAAGGRVVLSAGALQSPALLMFSGIGDPADLQRLQEGGRLDVPTEQWLNNTAVGAGLFDNPNTFIELSSPSISSYTYSYAAPAAEDAAALVQRRAGPYTFAGQTSVFWTTRAHDDGSVATLQGTIGTAGYGEYTGNDTVTLNVYGTSGLGSSGRVVLDDNFVPGPDGDVYYSAPQDAQDIASFIREIFDALPGSGLTPRNIPADASLDDIVTYITTSSQYARGQVNHWSSSCRLTECVDAQTRVVGTSNLHVVDGSIVPPLSVNPQMGIMSVAEKAAEVILGL